MNESAGCADTMSSASSVSFRLFLSAQEFAKGKGGVGEGEKMCAAIGGRVEGGPGKFILVS